ncbi:hypothetical protein [Algoriphagus sp. NG3]|uniref:hypothetical protein n=1 Tax=Algoriphagus sp. NG3 TaxID=3097546 RepID=UPI002A7EF95B|nr:hypothetical protein [Algoriphagus sp. NG3]WPR75770.1 hypothetical protein SLW71_00210 [Algoriphagus sp. NG3]
MKILIVENDSIKSNQVLSFLNDEFDIHKDISVRRSFQSGLEAILTIHYDLLILDMSIPTFDINATDDGGETLDRGGEIILQEMERENISIPAIILTQYEEFDNISLEEIDHELRLEYSKFYLGCIYYNISEDKWQNELKEMILKIKL